MARRIQFNATIVAGASPAIPGTATRRRAGTIARSSAVWVGGGLGPLASPSSRARGGRPRSSSRIENTAPRALAGRVRAGGHARAGRRWRADTPRPSDVATHQRYRRDLREPDGERSGQHRPDPTVSTAWITDLAGSRRRAGEISLRGTGESSRQSRGATG
jgi:hypothetical protein